VLLLLLFAGLSANPAGATADAWSEVAAASRGGCGRILPGPRSGPAASQRGLAGTGRPGCGAGAGKFAGRQAVKRSGYDAESDHGAWQQRSGFFPFVQASQGDSSGLFGTVMGPGPAMILACTTIVRITWARAGFWRYV